MKLIHESIYQAVLDQLIVVYKQEKIWNPLVMDSLLAPLHTPISKENFIKGIEVIKSQVKLLYTMHTSYFSLYIFCII